MKLISIHALFAFIFTLALAFSTHAQLIEIDGSNPLQELQTGHLKMGNPGLPDHEIIINNQYMTIGGQPVIPVMGEFHFSRYPKEKWEDVILKMKANGINIIATYILWILHEEIEGQFNWEGNNDLRAFAKLCKRHHMYFYPRIGPWCHAEIRNGGTPDWILTKKYIGDRSNEPVYQQYVRKWHEQIALQLKGLMYKDGGPVIGIQLENEYRRGKGGIPHIQWLKQAAIEAGFDVPMYTVTGWGNSSIPENEVIPLWGGYPSEPWATNTNKLGINQNFFFDSPKNDENIGNEGIKKDWRPGTDYSLYPYFTCELGVGNQISEHRRPIIGKLDGLAIATAKVGAGSNLVGYYVFTGGSNPTGIYTTMEENRDETSYYNEYPDISYDFQAAIRETGELAPSYFEVKKLHYFLNEFGSDLATMSTVFSPSNDKTKDLQTALRTNGKSAFLFGLNYLRGYQKPTQKKVQFSVKMNKETIVFPSKSIDIPDSSIFIWPVNMKLEDVTLKYATVQPLAKYDGAHSTDWYFFKTGQVDPEICINADQIVSVEFKISHVKKRDNDWLIKDIKTGLEHPVIIKTSNDKLHRLFILSDSQALNFWRLQDDTSKTHLFISDAGLYVNRNQLEVITTKTQAGITMLNGDFKIANSESVSNIEKTGGFDKYDLTFPAKKIIANVQPVPVLGDAQWLKTSVDNVSSKNELFNVIFIKEFNLGDPSRIKSATLLLATQQSGKLNVNETWINQPIDSNKVNQLDLTGYLQHGDNMLMLTFPTTSKNSAFAARLRVEYFNSAIFETKTDGSWVTTSQYLIPSKFQNVRGLKEPEIVSPADIPTTLKSNEYKLSIPDHYFDGLNNCYLHIDYAGDKARLRFNNHLIADNFFNGQTWSVNLGNWGDELENKNLKFELTHLQPGRKIYFEKQPDESSIGKTSIENIQFIPEYKVSLELE